MIGLIIAAALVAEILLVIFLPVVGWSVLGLLLFLILVLLFIPIGAHVKYTEEKLYAAVKISSFEYKLLPREKKANPKEEHPNKPKEKKAAEDNATPKQKKSFPFNFEEILELLKKAIKSLGKFGKLTVHRFMLHFIAAGNDPYKTAMTYNYINAALSSLAPICVKSFKIKDDVDVWTNVDFVQDKMKIETELSITLRLAQILRVALVFVFSALGILIRNRIRVHREKRENKNIAPANNTDDNNTNINTEERKDSNG